MDFEHPSGQGEPDDEDMDWLTNDISRLPRGPYNHKALLDPSGQMLQGLMLAIDNGGGPEADAKLAEYLLANGQDLPAFLSVYAPPPQKPTLPVRVPEAVPASRPAPEVMPGLGFAMSPSKLTNQQVRNSRLLDLTITPASPTAKKLVEAVLAQIKAREEWGGTRRRKRRKDAEAQLRDSVGAIVGNLLRSWGSAEPLPTSRTLNVNSFTGEAIRSRIFTGTVKAMAALNLMRTRRGGNPKDGGPGYTSRFWPTDGLLRLAFLHGVTAETVQNDFIRIKPRASICKPPKVKDQLRLKVIPPHPNALRSKPLPIDPQDEVAAVLRGQLEAFNAFARTVDVTGCVPPRWFRLFYGDFRLYGRLHAVGDGNYQSMAPGDRLADIRINGEPVVEIDFACSLLTFMHGLAGLPLPEGDLYAVPGFPRWVVKKWVNATLGNGRPLLRWPKDAVVEKPELARYSIAAVTAAVVTRYPMMAEPWRLAEGFSDLAPPHRAVIHMLMGIESDVVMDALLALQSQGILGLPMHDGLIVPASAEAVACRLLVEAGGRIAGLTLRLDVDR